MCTEVVAVIEQIAKHPRTPRRFRWAAAMSWQRNNHEMEDSHRWRPNTQCFFDLHCLEYLRQ